VFLGLSSGGLSFSYYFITSFRFQMLWDFFLQAWTWRKSWRLNISI
jgi:hypothetical protein